jgi:hypothetical protein
MNWPIARLRRATPEFSTTKREPESFAAVSKSIWPSASPSSKCSLSWLKPNSRPPVFSGASPLTDFTTLPCSSAPSGTSSLGMLGIAASCRSSASLAAFSSASSAGCVSLRAATSAFSVSASATSLAAIALPISFDNALRRSCEPCAFAMAERLTSSRSSNDFDRGSSPRRFKPVSNASAFSRIHLMSYIAALPIAHHDGCCSRPGSMRASCDRIRLPPHPRLLSPPPASSRHGAPRTPKARRGAASARQA